MKFLLLALCLGLALALNDNYKRDNQQNPSWIQESSYRSGKEYLYQYDTQVMTGIPKSSTIQAGFRISCEARVQFNTFSKVLVQLQRIVLYHINEPVVQWQASERLMPQEFLKELVGDEATTMESFLQIPFGFDYEAGQVLRVHLDDKETTWSANMKRGFISLFEMNMEKRYLKDESFPTLKAQNPPHTNLYTVFERSPVGDCATLYTVTPNSENDHRYVTKVRDYNQCFNMPVYVSTIFDGRLDKDAEQHNPLMNGATMRYTLRGNDQKFIIISAVGEGRIAFAPYKREEHVTSNLNQTLHLKESRTIGRETLEIPEVHPGQHKRDTLRVTLPARPVDCQDPFFPCTEEPKQLSERADVYSVEKLYLHLQMAAKNTQELTSEESTAHLRLFKDLLRTAPVSIHKQLWQKLYASQVNPQADNDRLCAQIYWNVLPNIGTEAAAEVILDVCSTDLRMTNKCTRSLQILALKTTPTTQILDKLIKLTQIDRLRKEVKQVAYLTLGSFGYKLTCEMEKQMKRIEKNEYMLKTVVRDSWKKSENFLEKQEKNLENRRSTIVSVYSQSEKKIVDVLVRLAQSSKQEDRILALKALGNSGLPGTLPILKRYLDNPAELQILRIMAITAHRRIQYPAPARQQAIQTLLKLYLTTSETNEIRSMAFLIMSDLKPELPIYETVALSLHHEKDAQVSSFVHSFLTTYSNSTYYPDRFRQLNFTKALKFAPQMNDGLEHSFMRRYGYFNEDYKKGGAFSLGMIGDISRYMGAAINLDTYTYGLVSEFMEIGVNTEGLSPFLNKLFGPRGMMTLNKSLFDLLKRGPRDISPQEKIHEIFRTLRIKPRSMPTPYGHIYYKMMGHELGYLEITNILKAITTTGSFPINWDEDGLRMGLPIEINTMYDLSDFQMTLPTEAGLPISLKWQVSSSTDIKGSLSLKVAPYMLESDREGQPPVAVEIGVDLKPKVVAEIQATMGLDLFYVKPVVGYRQLIKFNAPYRKDLKLDLAYRRMNLKWYQPVMEKPAVEMLLEPFSEFLLITKQNESPVLLSDRRNVYSSEGTRVTPLSHSYKLNALGYELAITGQVPYKFPVSPMSGRSLINIFWKPLENAPSVINIYAQNIRPSKEAVANSYAQTYQDVLTNRRDQYGRDFSRMDKSGVMKFDKYGRPLPQSTEEILPYSDPVDIKERPVNMQQMCNKFQQIFGKPMPFYNEDGSSAFVLLVDASSKSTIRTVQLESLWNHYRNGRIAQMFTRMWRSALPNCDTQEWQMISEFGVSYPLEVKEPKDIFDARWQRQLLKDLEYLISLESHKVANQRINMTILNGLEQFNYPAMIRVPTYRILEGLVPEQLYRLMNVSGSTIYNRRWDSYWRYLVPVYKQAQQEVRVNVDHSFIKRDLPLTEQLSQVIKVQEYFLRDLRDIITKNVVAHAELPVIQWIDYIQARTVYLIRETFYKDLVKDLIHDADRIRTSLNKAEANVDSIASLMTKMMERTTSVSQQLDEEGKPVVVFKPEVLRKVSNEPSLFYTNDRSQDIRQNRYRPSSFYSTEDEELENQAQEQEIWKSLRLSLYKFSLTQVKFIEKVQLAISNKRRFDFDQWTQLMRETRDNLDILDEVLRKKSISDPIIRQTLLLVTVQNEFCIELLEQWRKISADKVRKTEKSEDSKRFKSNMMTMKEHGLYYGERVSMLYHNDLMQRVVVPHLDRKEFPVYRQIRENKRTMLPELREFQLYVAYNFTNMKKPERIFTQCDKFCGEISRHINEISEIEKALVELGPVPKLYVVSELMDALHYLKFTTEFGSRTLYSIHDQRRFTYLQKLSNMATKVQSLISNLSPIFNKYEQYNDVDQRIPRMPILNTMPIDTRVLDVQDVLVQQKMLLDQIRRFAQDPDITNAVLSQVLNTVVDHCEVLQETLKQNKIQVQSALEQKKLFERQAISTVWTEALNQQHSLYEALRNIYNNHDQLRDVTRSTERINSLEMEITKLEETHQETLTNAQNKDPEVNYEYETYHDSYRTQPLRDQPRFESQLKIQPLTPFEYLPTGVTALLNFTWGSSKDLNKNAKIQFMASRSVEQIMYLFKQMSAVLRSEDIVDSINRRLNDEPWMADNTMQTLNTFNHLHLIAQAQKEQLPEWLLNYLRYTQDAFKAYYWNQYTRQPASQIVSQDQIHAMIDVSNINKKWDLYLLNNDETNIYQDITICKWGEKFPLIQNYRPVKDKVMSYFTNSHKPTRCMVNNNKIYTFDNVNYQLPYTLGKKEALLAADCSDEKSFAITMVKSNTSFNGHIVRLINEDKIVEVIPSYLHTEVRVNGEVIVLNENKPFIFSKKLHYDLFQPTLKIVRKGWRVEVEFPLTGVYFLMEGTFVQIRVSEMFKRRVCGLCSNFDNQMSWEFEGPKNEIYSSSQLFAQSYILNRDDRHTYRDSKPEFTTQNDKYYDIVSHYRPKGGSGKYNMNEDKDDDKDDDEKRIWEQPKDVQDKQPRNRQDQQDKQDSRENNIDRQRNQDPRKPIQEHCKPSLVTVLKKRKFTGQTCFSVDNVEKCPTDCPFALEQRIKKVNYVCLEAFDPRIKKLTRIASYGAIKQIDKVRGEIIFRKATQHVRCHSEELED